MDEAQSSKDLVRADQSRKEKIIRIVYRITIACAYLWMLFPYYYAVFLLIAGPLGFESQWREILSWNIAFGIVMVVQGVIAVTVIEGVFMMVAKFATVDVHRNSSKLRVRVPIFVLLFSAALTFLLVWIDSL